MDERMKSMALGSLVLIWGVFTGEEHKVITLTDGLKTGFLIVTTGAIVVLVLDYVESLMGYFAARQRIPGQKVKPMNYRGWERRTKVGKHLIGCLTLLVLLCLLFEALWRGSGPTEVHAQTNSPMSQFLGHWCGNDTNGNNFMVLDVYDQPEEAIYSNRGSSQEACDISHPKSDVLELLCGNHFYIRAQRQDSFLRADWEEHNAPTASGVSLLQDCSH
jgi:hypothetical protein